MTPLNLTRLERIGFVIAGYLIVALTGGAALASWVEPDQPVIVEGPHLVEFAPGPEPWSWEPQEPEPLKLGEIKV